MRYTSLFATALAGLSPFLTQAQPAPAQSRPPIIFIAREVEKVGHSAMHLKFEAEWAAALVRAGNNTPSLGIVSETGPAEAWWLVPYASFEAMGASGGASSQAVMEKYSLMDAAHIDSWRGMTAVLRADLSHGDAANLATMRGLEITTWRIRPGHDGKFVEATKMYGGAAKRAGSSAAWATYEIVAGAPTGTFLSFSAKRSMADYDRDMKDGQAVFGGITTEEGAALNKFLSESVMTWETNRFRVDPNISIAGDDLIKADAKFWTPSWKKTPAKAATKP